jgi:hypothetical protein
VQLANFPACLLGVNMLLSLTIIKARPGLHRVISAHCRFVLNGFNKNSPRALVQKVQANKVNTSGECFSGFAFNRVENDSVKKQPLIPFVFHNYKQVTL